MTTPNDIDTTNDFLVGYRGGGGIVMRIPGPPWPMDREMALRLAAWIVALADHSPGHEDFRAVLRAVEST